MRSLFSQESLKGAPGKALEDVILSGARHQRVSGEPTRVSAREAKDLLFQCGKRCFAAAQHDTAESGAAKQKQAATRRRGLPGPYQSSMGYSGTTWPGHPDWNEIGFLTGS